jgi:cellobiose phosphorylase
MRPRGTEPPLRAELLGINQLAKHARELATVHLVVTSPRENGLLGRLDRNEQALRAFHRATLAVDPSRRITPAAEWLLDNFYLIEEQMQMARWHLPRGYSRELPRLRRGPSEGMPRVYDIVLELVSHVDAEVDAESLSAFVAAYQTAAPLNLGELWAIPIMLRLALIENLQRITTRLTTARLDRNLADTWVDRLQDVAELNPSRLLVVVADLARADLPMSSSFVAEFCERLSRQNSVLHVARAWLEQRLVEEGRSIEQLVRWESQSQAADQVSVSHSIASLRFLGAMDAKRFVENLSLVDGSLRTDPAGVYSLMDFATRDRYRHVVEDLSRRCPMTELSVTRAAVALAEAGAREEGAGARAAHVGFYLVDKGLPALERKLGARRTLGTTAQRAVRRFPLAFYEGGIALIAVSGTAAYLRWAWALAVPGWGLAAFAPVILVCASQLAVTVMNRLSVLLVPPRLLPRLDYSAGIPADGRTMVVVPTLLESAASIERLIEVLEIHHLSNRDPRLHFALLTDFKDAPEELQPGDGGLLLAVRTGVEALNRKYPAEGRTGFFLFHRPRLWNAGEGRWMGYERKRGKLAEFNALLRGGSRDCFSDIVGDTGILPSIRYVITLDTDTQLPRDAARLLVATMAHRLNRPEIDPVRGIVREGYSILQPRVGVSLPSAGRSLFARLFSADAGIDPYTRAVSDVYQDLFGEGSFIGKGIYDVDAFERALAGRFPENAILSHDLLESCHARSGLVSDVEFYEEYPSRYNVDVNRRHRWIRGDWQILQWLLPRVPGADVRRIANPLSGLSLWKIFDNLRRSLVPAALLFWLVGGWLLLPQCGGFGSLLVVAVVAAPGLLAMLVDAPRKPADLPWSRHLRDVLGSAGRQLGQASLTVAFLPCDALVSLDAIGRTLLRLTTRRRLLQWQTSSDSEGSARSDFGGFFAAMWIAPAIGLAGGALVARCQPQALVPSLPFLVLWLCAPGIAWWISLPIKAEPLDLTGVQVAFLRRTARRTWHYFETLVTAEQNGLPPDNFQEIPNPTVATRTSPTNMGLALLANLGARDLGYLAVGPLIRRTESALAAMGRLERYRGHFYNWYDTRTLVPLLPLYVSSVDSGNLAGHLLTHASGLTELCDERIYSPELFAGLRDTLGVLREFAGASPALDRLDADLAGAPGTLGGAWILLGAAAPKAAQIEAALAGGPDEALEWGRALRKNCEDHREDLLLVAPWLSLAEPPRRWAERLDSVPTLREVSQWDRSLVPLIESERAEILGEPSQPRKAELDWLGGLSVAIGLAIAGARQRLSVLEDLAQRSSDLAEMDFTFLSVPERKLLSIGFNVTEGRRDSGVYDLLASEARFGCYVAIALGQISQDHWFSLGRLLVPSPGGPILVSWSGSMFEYLMPLLVMPNYDSTLLEHTCRAAVQVQISYGRLHRVPWGISESGYNLTDVHLNYQYRAFGVPGLGLKPGLSDDLVTAPYASALALAVAPRVACENLLRLKEAGCEGALGFYEAVDYTPARLPPGERAAVIRSFMAHHQGMSLLALTNLLKGRPMVRRFMSCPAFRAADLLLQERVPKAAASIFSNDLAGEETRPLAAGAGTMRTITDPAAPAPDVHLLSNGRYHVAITSAGGGYSRWGNLAVTRWREDATRDCWGTFLYLRDAATGTFWSAAHQPVRRPAKGYEAIFSQARAEFRQTRSGYETHVEIGVSPEDDVELRRIRITNLASATRGIELTTYAEVVLADPAADAAHPAFGNLFVQTEFVGSAILCTRRPKSPDEKPPWLVHLVVGQGGAPGEISCETDRSRFVGRGGTAAAPAALREPGPLSNTAGSVLDPIIALRHSVGLEPGETAVLDFIVGVAPSRESALALAEKYRNRRMTDRAFDLAWTHSQVTLRHLNATEGEAQLYGRLAGALLYADPARRAGPGILRHNLRGQSGLWSYGISGDTPIVLVRIGDPDKLELVRQLVKAHGYWRMKGLAVELVILNEDASVYRQSLHEQITGLIGSGIEAPLLDKPFGIFVRRIEQVPADDRVLLESVARIVLDAGNGSLAEQVERRIVQDPPVPPLVPSRAPRFERLPTPVARDLIFENGLGGFTRDGHEYVVTLAAGQATPAPWINVLANPSFGTVVSESGGSYTWSENAHEFRLTPWSDDPVQDTTGEALYLRDEETGQFWSPTPQPARGATPYVVRHGFGYTVFEHTENGLSSELWVYVAVDAPVKFSVWKLRNLSGRPRRVSVTGYWEWVLGDLRPKNLLHVQTEVDPKTGALCARNPYSTDFPGSIAFIDVANAACTYSGDRREFLGRNGSPGVPAALVRVGLSGKVGPGLDPCGAVHLAFDLADGQERETTFRLGSGRSMAEVQELVRRFRQPGACRTALEGVWSHWNRTLGAVNVDTPDPAVNVMANGWLLYQTLSGRVWGRTGFYQSGGAFGFRDQLQDVMALVHAEPGVTREHLLRAAGRQFREGDVQHWWHPPTGRGVRTHCSDDFLWLPYAVCRYVEAVGDSGVLDETVPFLEGRPVRPDEEAVYGLPNRSEDAATLYDHAVRAIEHGLRFGAHGLPFIGGGDWNDGLNRVGDKGRGESVWLAFFLYDVLIQFAPLARARSDPTFAERCLAQAGILRGNIERHAWDGQWYRRAYFDDGEPLGSASNPECQIDSLPQSWSVISGAGDPARSSLAMASVDLRLIRRREGLVQLLDPPFEASALDPGYIRGYIPGVRENGGQYTQGAIWVATAFALMGETEKAWELFNLLNPVSHGGTPAGIATYKVEPYVIAADVYAVGTNVGRGGWTWYTGSAGWMYRLLVETLLGVNLEGEALRLAPRLPAGWKTTKIHYRYRRTVYHISITQVAADGTTRPSLVLDGQEIPGPRLPLRDDGREHAVEMSILPKTAPTGGHYPIDSGPGV